MGLVRLSQPEENSMRSLFHRRSLFASTVLALLLAGKASAQPMPEEVTFDTADGVKIKGTYWPSPKQHKAPTILLLHDFDVTKGGDSHQNGWDSLGDALNKKGYAVLSFDFRGHGKSTGINPMVFFRGVVIPGGMLPAFPQNAYAVRAGSLTGVRPDKLPTVISFKDFKPGYYPYLMADIAAAKAFLDSKSDAKELNSSNLIVIGAGDGALLGQAWVNSEFHRKKATPPAGGVGLAGFGRWTIETESEGQDIAGCIWLTISQSLAGREYNRSLEIWQRETSKQQSKVQMVFVYGKQDTAGADLALSGMQHTFPPKNAQTFWQRGDEKPKDLALSGEKAIDGTKLTGSKLLSPELKTEEFIVGYLDTFFEKQGTKQARVHKFDDSFYVWTLPQGIQGAKIENDKTTRVPPVKLLLFYALP
jgi:hypothetical protein